MAPEQQLAALDRYDPAIRARLDAYRDAYTAWRAASKDLKDRTEKRLELAQEVDRLQFAIEEIDAVAPQAGEDDELVATINRLQDVDALREAAETALVAIDGADAVGGVGGEEEPASDLVGRAQAALEGAIAEYGKRERRFGGSTTIWGGRCIPFDLQQGTGKCFYTGRQTDRRVIFARAY